MDAKQLRGWIGSDKAGYAPVALVVCWVAALYARTVFFDYNVMDDADYILTNPFVVDGFSLSSIKWAFTPHNLEPGIYYMPLSWLSLMLDGTFWGADPAGYHLTNLVLFSIDAALVYLFLARLTGGKVTPLLATLLFALHPMRVESVVWVSQRKDMLSTCFFLLSALWYLNGRRGGAKGAFAASLALFAAGLLSKPNVVVLPLALLVVEFFLRAGEKDDGPDLRRTAVVLAPYFLLSLGFALFVLSGSDGLRIELPFKYRLFTMAHAHLHYLYKSIAPVGLYISESHFQFAGVSPTLSLVVLSLLALAVAVAVALRKRFPSFFIAWLWFLVTLAPMNGFLPVGNILWSDKFTLIPHIGLALGAASLLKNLHGRMPRAALCAGAAAMVALTALTFDYSGKWRNTYEIYTNTLERGGPPGFAYTFLAAAQTLNGNLPGALELLNKAEEADPGYQLLYYDRGKLYEGMGKYDEAARDYLNSIRLFPGDYMAMKRLALIYEQKGDYESAARYRTMAEGLAPGR